MRKDYGRQRITPEERPSPAPAAAPSVPPRARRAAAPSAFASAMTVGAAFAAAALLPSRFPSAAIPSAVAALATAVAASFVAALLAARGAGGLRRAAPLPAFVAAAFLQLLLVGSSGGRYALTLLAVVIVGAYVAALRGISAGKGRVGASDLSNLVFAMFAMTGFFLLSFMSGIGAFAHLPIAASASIAGVAAVLMVRESLWHAGAESAARPAMLMAIGAIVAELHAALELLPTDATVNAAVTVVIAVFIVHAFRRGASGAPETRTLRRPFVYASCLVLAVLLTARWA